MSEPTAYARAGVDLGAGQRATELMKRAVQETFGPEVLSDVGSFGGLFRVANLKEMADPVLVASTDGVGTKTEVAARLNRWNSVGVDIVNHCLNDILVQGARPLFFLDYVASARLDPAQISTIVSGAAAACRAAGCSLIGGETAEMPGVYREGAVDLVGTIVGIVERERLITGGAIRAGHLVLGLPSSGLHTNGYTLARSILDGFDWLEPRPALNDRSIGDILLEPHLSYLADLQQLWAAGLQVSGMAHITGGGLIDNPPRVFPDGLGALIRRESWPAPPIYHLIQEHGNVAEAEMFRVFNMGLGMLLFLPPEQADQAQRVLPHALLVGEISSGIDGVLIQ